MIWLDQVGEFVHDDVIDHEYRCFDQSPIQVYVILYSAGPSAEAIVHDLCARKVYPDPRVAAMDFTFGRILSFARSMELPSEGV